jgi:beta-glucosidase
METVEKQLEDVPHYMQCHTDSKGNVYTFTFGMNWKGIIADNRTSKYKVAP